MKHHKSVLIALVTGCCFLCTDFKVGAQAQNLNTASNDSAYNQRESELKYYQQKYNRYQYLYEQGAISRRELERAGLQYQRAQERFNQPKKPNSTNLNLSPQQIQNYRTVQKELRIRQMEKILIINH